MRKIYFLLLLLFSTTIANAQLTSYGFASSSGTYTPITGGTVHSSGSTIDDAAFAVTLPFTFTFNGTAYTEIYVSENGYISFGSTNPGTTTRSAISSTTTGFEVAAAFSRDLGGSGTTTELRSQVIGTAPNQIFVAQFQNFANYGSTQNYNFQIQLAQANDDPSLQTVKFVYGTFGNLTSTTGQVGLRGTTNATYFNRTTTSNWAATTLGTSNSATCTISTTVFPSSGLTFTYTPPAACTGTPLGGTTVASSSTICAGLPVSLNITGSSTGLLGLTYQWQDSTSGGTFNDISGATNETYIALPTSITAYRRRIFCNGNTNDYSVPVTVTPTAPIYGSLPFVEGFETTWLSNCGGVRVNPSINWRSAPLTTDSSWRRNDDNANGWSSTSGAYTPAASQGTYSARFHSYQASNGSSGRMDLFLDCSSGSSDKRLSFDYINTSGSDLLQVYLSTDDGVSFSLLDTIRIRTAWSNKIIDFSSNSPQTVLRFRAIADFGATDIGLDNLSVITISSADLAATSIVNPLISLIATSAGTITLKVTNSGSAPIDFATSNALVGVQVTNPNGTVSSYNTTLNTGGLSSGATQDVQITTSANFTTLGVHHLRGWVALTGDGNVINDTTNRVSIVVNPRVVAAIANGNWGDASTWNGGVIPSSVDSVNITGFNVTLDGSAVAPYNAFSIGIGAAGTLTGGPKALVIGTTGGGKNAFTVSSTGTLLVNAATNITHNGFILFNSGSNFTMSGGNLTIDGNDGTDAGSVSSVNDLFGIGTSATNYSSGTINVTGGTITIVDPHRYSTASGSIVYRGASGSNVNFGAGNTVVLGDGVSTHSSNGATGFNLNTYVNSGRLSLGSLVLNGGSTEGRFLTTSWTFGINGNFTINSGSEVRFTTTAYLTGNLTNNGIFANSGTTQFSNYLNGTATVSTTPVTISGTGIFRNTIPSLSISAAGTGYVVNDVLQVSGGTHSSPMALVVKAVNATGGITAFTIHNMGAYTVSPASSPVSTTGGTGTGATFSVSTLSTFVSTACFTSLTVNNTHADGVTIGNIERLPSATGHISGTLTMTNGIINNATPIILGTSASSRGTLTYTNGFIKGKFGRWFGNATNTTTTGDFPVGKDTIQNARVEFTTAPTKGGVLIAEFVKSAPTTAGLPLTDGAITLYKVANDGFWRIENDTITGGAYKLSLTARKFADLQVLSTLRSVKRPTNGTSWTLDGASSTNTGTLAIPVIVRTGLVGFSEFAIASGNDNLLPFTKLSFVGSKTADGNKLSWVVTNEFNTKGYELERSIDGINFAEMQFVVSKNVTATPSNYEYSFTDLSPFKGNTYYRLKQVDTDGKFTYSNIVVVRGINTTSLSISGVYPNPTSNYIKVLVASPSAKQITLRMVDVSGKIVLQSNKQVVNGDNPIEIDVKSLSKGSYSLMIICNEGCETKSSMFIKQ